VSASKNYGLIAARIYTSVYCRLIASERSTPPGDQIEDKYDQREHKQKVDQPATKVEAKAEEPQDQNDHKDCPKHISLSRNVGAPRA
jgi:hypothetical protein